MNDSVDDRAAVWADGVGYDLLDDYESLTPEQVGGLPMPIAVRLQGELDGDPLGLAAPRPSPGRETPWTFREIDGASRSFL